MEPPTLRPVTKATRPTKKKALLIGINYIGKPAQLSGCVDDIVNMRAVCAKLKYDEVCVLYDGQWIGVFDPADVRIGSTQPTRANMTAAFHWLVAGAAEGDHLYLHYSGHGGQLRELVPGSEETGMDDTLVPVDYDTAGMMRDDELYVLLVESLRRTGASLRAALDCCHSGTGMDLKYNLSPKAPAIVWNGDIRGVESAVTQDETTEGQLHALVTQLVAETVRTELKAWFGDSLVEKVMGPGSGSGDENSFIEWTSDGVRTIIPGSAISGRSIPRALAAAAPDVLAISGCADRQTSADAYFGGRAGGALTHYLLEALRNPVAGVSTWPTATDLLRDLRRRVLMGGYTQTPQISSELPITASTRFNLV